MLIYSLNALTLLVGRQEGNLSASTIPECHIHRFKVCFNCYKPDIASCSFPYHQALPQLPGGNSQQECFVTTVQYLLWRLDIITVTCNISVYEQSELSLKERLTPRTNLGPLLLRLEERPPEQLDYIGVSYGLTSDLLKSVDVIGISRQSQMTLRLHHFLVLLIKISFYCMTQICIARTCW